MAINASIRPSVPALYEKYLTASTVAVDEWTLSENMRADTANGGISQLEDHYKTFIVSIYARYGCKCSRDVDALCRQSKILLRSQELV